MHKLGMGEDTRQEGRERVGSCMRGEGTEMIKDFVSAQVFKLNFILGRQKGTVVLVYCAEKAKEENYKFWEIIQNILWMY